MKRLGLTVVLVVIILLLVAGVGYAMNRRSGGLFPGGVVKDTGSNISNYSAVFLTNGQVYFGQIKSESDKEVIIDDIYYLQVNQQVQQQDTNSKNPTPSPSTDIQLVKLGNELHGPNDRMRINRDQVLFTESLKNDSKVVTAIKDSQNK